MRKKSLILALYAGIAAAALSAPWSCAQVQPQRVEITAKRFAFSPGEITVKVNQPVVLVLKSADVGHGLRIRDFGIDLKVKAGQTAELKFTPNKIGNFIGHCSVFCGSGHGSMIFMLHVVS